MQDEIHAIHLSDTRWNIISTSEMTLRFIRRHFRAAASPFRNVTNRHSIVIDSSPNHAHITIDDEIWWDGNDPNELVNAFELVLHRWLLRNHRNRFGVFHASAVTNGRSTIVFSGPSGAGKSTLALSAVRNGYRYYTDEFVITDGQNLWGWPRAIRFDAITSDSICPAYLSSLQRESVWCTESQDAYVPYYPPSVEECASQPAKAEDVHFVHIERGESNTLRAMNTTEALKHLSEAAFFEPPVNLGALVGPKRVWCGQWTEPASFIELLNNMLECSE